jgi:hypothetical protein
MLEVWDVVGIVAEGDPICVSGVDLWRLPWTRSAEPPVMLPHPQHPAQLHLMRIYQIESAFGPLRFAAAEVSAGAWAFYQPRAPHRSVS